MNTEPTGANWPMGAPMGTTEAPPFSQTATVAPITLSGMPWLAGPDRLPEVLPPHLVGSPSGAASQRLALVLPNTPAAHQAHSGAISAGYMVNPGSSVGQAASGHQSFEDHSWYQAATMAASGCSGAEIELETGCPWDTLGPVQRAAYLCGANVPPEQIDILTGYPWTSTPQEVQAAEMVRYSVPLPAIEARTDVGFEQLIPMALAGPVASAIRDNVALATISERICVPLDLLQTRLAAAGMLSPQTAGYAAGPAASGSHGVAAHARFDFPARQMEWFDHVAATEAAGGSAVEGAAPWYQAALLAGQGWQPEYIDQATGFPWSRQSPVQKAAAMAAAGVPPEIVSLISGHAQWEGMTNGERATIMIAWAVPLPLVELRTWIPQADLVQTAIDGPVTDALKLHVPLALISSKLGIPLDELQTRLLQAGLIRTSVPPSQGSA